MKRNCFGFVVVVYAITGGGHGALGEHSSSHEIHDHDEKPFFEQAAVYVLESGTNSIMLLPPVGDSDVAEEILLAFMVLLAESADQDGLEEAEEAAETSWEAYLEGELEPTILMEDKVVSPSESTVYAVFLAEPLVQVPLNITYEGSYALLVEHGSDEVSVVVTSAKGLMLTAVAEEGVEEDKEEEDKSSPATGPQWGNAIVASFIVSICSLVGIFIVASDYVSQKIELSYACMFAAGALLTASLLHIIPEALEGLESDYDNFHDMGIGAGTAILGGIFLGVLVHAFLETGQTVKLGAAHVNAHAHEGRIADDTCDRNTPNAATVVSSLSTAKLGQDLAEAPTEGGLGADDDVSAQVGASVSSSPPTAMMNSGNVYSANLHTLMEGRKEKALTDIKDLQPGSWNLIIGDFVHNFADGVTIGAAFLGCSSTVGWAVTASTVLHEVPQELADFMALINGGMSKMQALFFNFLSAISAILGAIFILLLSESLTSADVSYILLVGAGTFVFIGLADLIPKGLEVPPDSTSTTFSVLRLRQGFKLVSFIVGALIIGIPLIFDQHCEAGHQGHDH